MLPALHIRRLQLAAQSSPSHTPIASPLTPPMASPHPSYTTTYQDVSLPLLTSLAPSPQLPSSQESRIAHDPDEGDLSQRAQSWRTHLETRRQSERQDMNSQFSGYRHCHVQEFDPRQPSDQHERDRVHQHPVFATFKEENGYNGRLHHSVTTQPSAHPIHDGNKKRSRRMSNSERGKLYRSRRKDYVETLEHEVHALKRRVQELEDENEHVQLIGKTQETKMTQHPNRDLSYSLLARHICEYFTQFEYGVSPTRMNTSGTATTLRQVNFLKSILDPNMQFGTQYGIHMLMKQWERYSQYHSAIRFQLSNLEILSNDTIPVVCAAASLKVRFNRTTIEKIFPHILWNESLVQKLLGMEITYFVDNKFQFGTNGLVERYDVEVDFIGALVKALGNIRDAMLVVGQAAITERHLIGPVDDLQESEEDEMVEGGIVKPVSTSWNNSHESSVKSGQTLARNYDSTP